MHDFHGCVIGGCRCVTHQKYVAFLAGRSYTNATLEDRLTEALRCLDECYSDIDAGYGVDVIQENIDVYRVSEVKRERREV
jgi:hypothetical protein